MATTLRKGDLADSRTHVRVLIADDDPGARALLRHWLDHHGWLDVVGEAADGVQAVEAARRIRPQLVVLDLAMPRMDGLEAAAEIRRVLPDTRIVIHSAFSAGRMAQKAIGAGADVYVEKAAERAQLLAVLEGLFPARETVPAGGSAEAGADPAQAPAQTSLDDLLLDALDVGVLLVDGDGHVRSANFEATLALGVSTSHLVGSSLTDLLAAARHPDGRDTGLDVPDPVAAALASGRPHSGQALRLDKQGGGSSWLSISVRPVRGAEGAGPSGAVVVVRDVTEEHRLREVVRDVHARLPRLLDAVDTPLAVLRARPGEGVSSTDFVVVHTNRAARALTGWVAASRIHRDAFDGHSTQLQSIGDDEVVVAWQAAGGSSSMRTPQALGNSRPGPLEAAELLEAAVASSPVGAILLDASARVVIANPVADRLLGGSALLGSGPPTRTLRWADTKEPVGDEDLPVRAACQGTPFDDLELHVTDEDDPGGGTYLRISGRPVLDPRGTPAGAVVSVLDDTVTKETEESLATTHEELRRSNTELANFASIASHDLAQPLQKVYGFAQLLQEGGIEDAQAGDFIDRIVVGCERMDTLIRDLLTFSRLTSEARPFETVELTGVVEDVVELFERQIAQATAQIDVGPLPEVLADRTQMSQLFQNLVGNALTYVASGVRPKISIHSVRDEGEWRITVVDNGIGISPENRERAFAMFQRLVSAEEYPGTGIGLAVCLKIAERHGGRIWIEGNPEGGSSISFTLPDRPQR